MLGEAYSLTADSAKPPQNKTVLITGGGSGIGLATAIYLHAHGNNVAILDKAGRPSAASKELTMSSRCLYIPCDVLDWVSQRRAFTQAAEHFNGLDGIFINAGVTEIGDQFWQDEYDADGQLTAPNRITIDVDIRAVGDSLKLAMHHLRNDSDAKSGKRKGSGRGRGGSIVMTSSLAGYLASAGAPHYSAAKHGVVGYMRALKGECANVNIAISVVAPAITLTALVLVGREDGPSLEEWGKDMQTRGVAINTAETIALAVASLMGEGMKANGKGLLIQSNRIQDVEAGLAKSRAEWMGKEMLDLFRGGRNAPLFANTKL